MGNVKIDVVKVVEVKKLVVIVEKSLELIYKKCKLVIFYVEGVFWSGKLWDVFFIFMELIEKYYVDVKKNYKK